MSQDWGPRTCEQCGEPFLPRRWQQNKCSDACRKACYAARKRERWAREHPQVIAHRSCVVCGALFVPQTVWAKACSPECRAQHKRNTANAHTAGTAVPAGDTPHQCLQCGQPFHGHPNAKVCSARCMRLRKRDARRASKAWLCIACGQPFEANHNDRYTCSPACKKAALARKNKRGATRERNKTTVARRRQRIAEDPAYREKLAERDRRCRAKKLLLQASLDVMRINEYGDRSTGPIEESRRAGTESGNSTYGDAVALDRGTQG